MGPAPSKPPQVECSLQDQQHVASPDYNPGRIYIDRPNRVALPHQDGDGYLAETTGWFTQYLGARTARGVPARQEHPRHLVPARAAPANPHGLYAFRTTFDHSAAVPRPPCEKWSDGSVGGRYRPVTAAAGDHAFIGTDKRTRVHV